MLNLGTGEIAIIAALLLIFFGAEKMPEIGRALSRSISEFKKGLQGEDEPQEKKPPEPTSSPNIEPYTRKTVKKKAAGKKMVSKKSAGERMAAKKLTPTKKLKG